MTSDILKYLAICRAYDQESFASLDGWFAIVAELALYRIPGRHGA